MVRFDLYNIRDLLTSMIFASFIIFNASEYSFVSVALLSGLLLVSHIWISLHKGDKGLLLSFNTMHKKMILFDFFCFLSAVWASNFTSAFEDGVSILANIICISIVYLCYQKDRTVERLVRTVMLGGVIISIYIILFYGVSNFISMANNSMRLAGDVGNANTIGFVMSITVATFVFYYFKNGVSIKLFFGVFPLGVLAVSQSRTALITLGAGILIIVLKLRDKKKNLADVVKIWRSVAVLVVGVWFCVTKTSLLSGIIERMSNLFLAIGGNSVAENSFSERMTYISGGFLFFLQHPILGIGIGNSSVVTRNIFGYITYLHNNYIELLVCGGVIGFICYYSMFAYSLKNTFRFSKIYRDNENNLICLVFIFMMLVADIGRVSYYRKETYFLLMIIFLNIKNNRNCSGLPSRSWP